MGIFAQEPLLSAMRPGDRAALLAAGDGRRYQAGERLMQQGAAEDFVIAISSGWAVVQAAAANGRALILGLCGPKDIVGELAVLDGRPRSATVTSLTPLDGHLVSGVRFHGFLKDRPFAGVAILRGMALRLRAIDGHSRDLATLPVLQRLARLLISLDQTALRAVFAGQFSQQELATAIGATRESVAKSLAALRTREVLVTTERRIQILDRGALVAIADL
ncbi:Crp/Fnr family transcriptional regulator [Catenulispora pinisilvae]|uniref:Crp/Fnr family transcriptional regulator n=1 Tax=Catenulispora pinisilvae TaxID=2705253 RepID=UPI00189196A8|nr:Crp/Fnr family transcriptional regulator [Catenulispora pinisilvae]